MIILIYRDKVNLVQHNLLVTVPTWTTNGIMCTLGSLDPLGEHLELSLLHHKLEQSYSKILIITSPEVYSFN